MAQLENGHCTVDEATRASKTKSKTSTTNESDDLFKKIKSDEQPALKQVAEIPEWQKLVDGLTLFNLMSVDIDNGIASEGCRGTSMGAGVRNELVASPNIKIENFMN